MAETIRANNHAKFTLLKGKGLKVTADATGSGKLWVFPGSTGVETILDGRTVASGESEALGPYSDAVRVQIECYAGSVSFDQFSPREEATKFGSTIKRVTTSTYTISDGDHGYLLDFQAGCTVTVASGLRSDFSCGWTQSGASAVVFAAAAGVTIQSAGGLLSSGGQFLTGGLAMFDLNTVRLFGALA